MTKNIRHKLLVWLMAFVAFASLVPADVFAVAGSVYFTPNGGTVINESEFTVEVRGNVPDPGFWGGGATIKFTYDTTKLQLISYDDTGGAFQAANTKNWTGTGAGTVRYQAQVYFNTPGVNNQKIISAKFKAINTGSIPLNFAAETNVNDGPTTGTASTFTVQAATCTAGQVGTPPNCTTPAPSPSTAPTPAPSKAPTPIKTPTPATPTPVVTVPTVEETPQPVAQSDGGLKIENVKTTTSRQKNNITWKLNKSEAEPKVTYGLTKSTLKTEATIKKLSDGSYEAELAGLKPGTLYYFLIKASTPDQLQGANYSGTLTTKGYPVQLTVQQNGVLAPGAKVKIGERSFIANKNAIVTTELGDGKYAASVTPLDDPSSYAASFVVKKVSIPKSGEPDTQSFTLNVAIKNTNTSANDTGIMYAILAGSAAVLGISGFVGFLLYRRKQAQAETDMDGDLLIANYGNTVDDYRAQTPEPNLEMQDLVTPAPAYASEQMNDDTMQQQQFDTYSIDSQAPLEADEPAYQSIQDDTVQLQEQPPQQAIEQIENTEQYIEPAQNPTAQFTEQQTTIEQIDEQLSSPVIAVESIEETITDNEEAVYHPETGELDIIHGHLHTPVVATPNNNLSEVVAPDPTPQPATLSAPTIPAPPYGPPPSGLPTQQLPMVTPQ